MPERSFLHRRIRADEICPLAGPGDRHRRRVSGRRRVRGSTPAAPIALIGGHPGPASGQTCRADARLPAKALPAHALGGGHDVQRLVVVRHDVVFDRARHFLFQAVPLDGIAEAMNCTFFGLFTGILGLAAYAWLNGKTQNVLDDVTELRKSVANLVTSAKAALRG